MISLDAQDRIRDLHRKAGDPTVHCVILQAGKLNCFCYFTGGGQAAPDSLRGRRTNTLPNTSQALAFPKALSALATCDLHVQLVPIVKIHNCPPSITALPSLPLLRHGSPHAWLGRFQDLSQEKIPQVQDQAMWHFDPLSHTPVLTDIKIHGI